MGFGGSAQAMITAIKNNEKMRSKRDKFKRSVSKRSIKEKPEYDFPKATPEQLLEIRHRMRRENRVMWLKVAIGSVIVIIALVWVLLAS